MAAVARIVIPATPRMVLRRMWRIVDLHQDGARCVDALGNNLRRYRFHDTHVAGRGNDPRHLQAGTGEKCFIFARGSLLTAGEYQHHHVRTAETWRVPLAQDEL